MGPDRPVDLDGLAVDPGGAVAPFEQILAELRARMADGRLRPGDRLPTVRALATRLSVAPGTVARAYKELEQAGAVVSRSRAGTVVAVQRDLAEVQVRRAAEALVAVARTGGVADARVLAAVREALGR